MVILINHPGLKVVKGVQMQTPSPSIGLAYLGGFLKSKGIAYKAIDGCGEAMDQILPYEKLNDILVQGLTDEQILERIPKNATVIGFTCLFSQCWPLVHRIARKVRTNFPNALLVAGGEHPTALPEPILKARVFDVVVFGEGEETFYELIQKLDRKETWQGTSGTYHLNAAGEMVKNCPRKRVTDVDAFPLPDWESWPIEEYISRAQVTGVHLGRQLPILGSRGCPFACTFCSNENMWTQRYIMRNAKWLVDEMELMKRRYRLDGFTFMDSTFIVNRQKVRDFAEELIQRKLEIVYQLPAGTRCEAFDQELAFALEKSGLRNFAFAPESGDETILKLIKKQVSIPRLIAAIKMVLKTKMTVGCFIVIGFPEDTVQSLKKTLKLIRRLAVLGVHDVTVSKFTPYPGSPLYTRFVKEGCIIDDYQEADKMINFFAQDAESFCDSIDSKRLHRWMIWMFFNFYVLSALVRPWRVLNNFYLYFTRGIESARYVRFFHDLFYLRRTRWRVTELPPEKKAA